MKPIAAIMLIIVTALCDTECPIECFCDQVTGCAGNQFITQFPKIYTDLQPLTVLPIYRVEYHDYVVNHLEEREFLEIISKLSEVSLSRNSIESLDNDTFSIKSTSFVSPSENTQFSENKDTRMFQDESGESAESESYNSQIESSVTSSSAKISGDSDAILNLKVLDLSQNKLKYFVGGGKLANLRRLDLSSNLLQVFEISALMSLESVNLRNNRISFLDQNTFQNLRNLQYLNLNNNLLGFLDSSTFSHLPALTHLILSSNPVTNLAPGFYWNSGVQFVDMSQTGLAIIPASLTKSIRNFHSTRNNLTIIKQTDFESYPNIETLILDENSIKIVEDDAFGRLEFLTKLSLAGNKLTQVPQNLTPSLKILNLERNQISNITSTDFQNLQNLEVLNLSQNKISSLPSSVFRELSHLKTLRLSDNSIDVIYHDSFLNLLSLEILDISRNPLKVIVNGAFRHLGKVVHLHLSHLPDSIQFSVKTFLPLENLHALELTQSPHLTQKLFQSGAFSLFTSNFLRQLYIQQCGLSDLAMVSEVLVDLNFESVKMSDNPWNCENVQGTPLQELISTGRITDHPRCASPAPLKNVFLADLNISRVTEPPNVTKSINKLGYQRRRKFSGENYNSSISTRPPGNLRKTVSTDLLESGDEAVPTQSYFDYPTSNRGESITGESSESGKQTQLTNDQPEKIKGDHLPNKPWSSRKEIRGYSPSTKTNDDGAIIDERKWVRRKEKGAAVVQQSIDGFPSLYLDNDKVVSRAYSAPENSPENPKYSYLKVEDNGTFQPERISVTGQREELEGLNNVPVIVRTLVISSVTCFLAFLGIVVVSLAVYKKILKRNCRLCSSGISVETENNEGRAVGYSRLCSRSQPRQESSAINSDIFGYFERRDTDHVELTGIANNFYLENETIYHIT